MDNSDSDRLKPTSKLHCPHNARHAAFSAFPPPPSKHTQYKRLSTLADQPHLLRASHLHPPTPLVLVSFSLALGTVWPARKERVLGALVVFTGGRL